MRAQQVEFLLSGFRAADGSNLAGGLVYTYEPGTTTERTTWADRGKSTALSNPIVLDGYGKKQVFADGAYDFVVKDSDGNLLYTFSGLEYGVADSVLEYGGTSSGAANVYTISVSPTITEYKAGQVFRFISHQTNTTTTPTLAVNGLSAVTIRNFDGSALRASDLQSTQVITVLYNGTNFLMSPVPTSGFITPTLGGFAVQPSTIICHYIKVNRGLWIQFLCSNGTSDATTFTIPIPFTASAIGGMAWEARLTSQYDNGAAVTNCPGKASIAQNTATINVLMEGTGTTGWTNVNGKSCAFQLFMEVD